MGFSFRSKWRPWLFFPGLFLFFGCATPAPVVTAPKKDPQEDRLLLMQQRMEEKDAQLERLNAKMEALQAKQEMEARSGGADALAISELPRVKLSPKREPEPKDPAEDLVDVEEAVSLADSRHETMHWYFRGLTLLGRKQYEEAFESFSAFLKASPRHVYSDRAQFWIGECRFRAENYPMALIAFNRLEGEFPTSFRRVEAGYKKSIALEKIGRAEEAVLHLKELVRRFPRHPLTSEASARLASLEVKLAK